MATKLQNFLEGSTPLAPRWASLKNDGSIDAICDSRVQILDFGSGAVFFWEVRDQSIFRTKVIYFSTKDENITIPTEKMRAKK